MQAYVSLLNPPVLEGIWTFGMHYQALVSPEDGLQVGWPEEWQLLLVKFWNVPPHK